MEEFNFLAKAVGVCSLPMAYWCVLSLMRFNIQYSLLLLQVVELWTYKTLIFRCTNLIYYLISSHDTILFQLMTIVCNEGVLYIAYSGVICRINELWFVCSRCRVKIVVGNLSGSPLEQLDNLQHISTAVCSDDHAQALMNTLFSSVRVKCEYQILTL